MKKIALAILAFIMPVNVAAAYEPPPVPELKSPTELKELLDLDSLYPNPPLPITNIPWVTEQKEIFSKMLYDAGVSEGNWDGHLSRVGLKMMTDCIAAYYSERISFALALEYYETMPEHIHTEFSQVLSQCYYFAKEEEANLI